MTQEHNFVMPEKISENEPVPPYETVEEARQSLADAYNEWQVALNSSNFRIKPEDEVVHALMNGQAEVKRLRKAGVKYRSVVWMLGDGKGKGALGYLSALPGQDEKFIIDLGQYKDLQASQGGNPNTIQELASFDFSRIGQTPPEASTFENIKQRFLQSARYLEYFATVQTINDYDMHWLRILLRAMRENYSASAQHKTEGQENSKLIASWLDAMQDAANATRNTEWAKHGQLGQPSQMVYELDPVLKKAVLDFVQYLRASM